MRFILYIFKRFFVDRFHDQSAQMAYFFMLSIFPFLIFVLSLLSFFPIYSTDVLSAIKQFAPKGSYALIENNIILIFDRQSTRLASFSLISSFWISSMAVQSIVRAMNDAYGIIRKEGFFLALGKDLFLTAILMITLTISLLVPIGEEIGRVFLSSRLDMPLIFYESWFLIKWGIGTIYLFFFFLLVYRLVPSGKIPFSSVLPGAIFAIVGWQGASIGFSYYVSYINYSQLYGQLGSIIVLMIWFYLTAAVLLTGGLINASFFSSNHE
ncbi:YihY/virulence factor BrkB family protein [Siminovitchia terrae]|uniref:YihY/virulence factor BrkB family protein n=1 Tax=Siminovitchia terrae TaxID=1914933 RepID=UPI0028AC11A8|nr:YihY/virulence factor BrkB family protein [Siminovitchia terrae]